nr:hypothetical protein Itr_chr03CG07690 [Ipomoea trifida]
MLLLVRRPSTINHHHRYAPSVMPQAEEDGHRVLYSVGNDERRRESGEVERKGVTERLAPLGHNAIVESRRYELCW